MEMLQILIRTVGLNDSFFYQLALAVLLYFISKKLFFEPYLIQLKKREEKTKGRMARHQEIDLRLERKKKEYEKKAQKINREFQEVFSQIHLQAQDDYINENQKIEKEQKLWIQKQRNLIQQALAEQEKSLEKDFPFLTQLLADKIKG